MSAATNDAAGGISGTLDASAANMASIDSGHQRHGAKKKKYQRAASRWQSA